MSGRRRDPNQPGWLYFRHKRLQARLTLRGLAEATGVDYRTIHGIERGWRGASDETLIKLADALGIDAAELDANRPVIPPRRQRTGAA